MSDPINEFKKQFDERNSQDHSPNQENIDPPPPDGDPGTKGNAMFLMGNEDPSATNSAEASANFATQKGPVNINLTLNLNFDFQGLIPPKPDAGPFTVGGSAKP